MLPDGFIWEPFAEGHRVRWGQRSLASTTPLDGGGVRVCVQPDSLRMHHRFFASYSTGQRYVEAWARKWEAEIRAGGSQGSTLYAPGTMRAPESGTVQTSHPRRSKRR